MLRTLAIVGFVAAASLAGLYAYLRRTDKR
jgi:hypothetical protein